MNKGYNKVLTIGVVWKPKKFTFQQYVTLIGLGLGLMCNNWSTIGCYTSCSIFSWAIF